jgi:hypothetical protein
MVDEMNKKTSKEDHTVIMSDKYLSESGVQGGKVVGEHLALGSLILGIPFLIIGLYALINMSFGWGFPTHTAGIIAALLVTVIGLLLVIGGCSIYRDKHAKN